MKQKVHNEWFQPLVKRSCPCGCKGTQVFAWGEYVNAKWRTVEHFCKECFVGRVLSRLIPHMKECGCMFVLKPRMGHRIPDWIRMPVQTECAA